MPSKKQKAAVVAPSAPEIEKYANSALKKWVKAVGSHRVLKMRAFGKSKAVIDGHFHVELTICGAPRMSKLNKEYRGKVGLTDVLSFAADPFFQHKGVLGDLVICAPVVLKQAREYQHSWKKELDVLIVHGLLHLLHFDHEQGETEAREMAKWERKLLGLSAKTSLITRASLVQN
jgi:probable rRNA maturation factor